MGDGTTATLTEAQTAFLCERPHAIVATIMSDGRPQLTPNWYLWDGERFWISTLDWTVKVKNAKRDPRVTLCIDGPSRRTNYVQVFGTAEVQEGDVREGTLDLIRKYETTEEAALQHWEDIKEDRVLIVVTPERFQWRYDD
ncbi:MAG TPA: PPOX class F420-dependent oxidoreductase [Candidatus Limnocylindrales bacterium]